jgi:hypothetical protein
LQFAVQCAFNENEKEKKNGGGNCQKANKDGVEAGHVVRGLAKISIVRPRKPCLLIRDRSIRTNSMQLTHDHSISELNSQLFHVLTYPALILHYIPLN